MNSISLKEAAARREAVEFGGWSVDAIHSIRHKTEIILVQKMRCFIK